MVVEVPKRRASAAHTPPIMRPWVGRARRDIAAPSSACGGDCLVDFPFICPPRYGDERNKASLYGAIPTLGIVGVRP
ncbi:hypothetical protein GCM10010279_10300 [Streptomyces mutabilis]|nr:hypothetical protein GCM10010279_10300 [Streptomyces mutabilis]